MGLTKKIDYEFKSKVLKENSWLLKTQRITSYRDYRDWLLDTTGQYLPTSKAVEDCQFSTYRELVEFCADAGLSNELNECKKINQSCFKRVSRLKERINNMLLSGACVFLTLTFIDEILQTTNEQTRRKYVSRFLKNNGVSYVGNIDYGKEKGREHYHALIQIDKNINYSDWNKNYGAVVGEKVHLKENGQDVVKLSKYVAKLTNHAIKKTAKRAHLIYSR